MKRLSVMLGTFVTALGLLAVLALAVDALEYEQTGACRDCVVLPHIADRFQS